MDKLYGTKKSETNIGELKQVVVPYTISLLTILTNNRLNLYKIWKEQSISEQLSSFLYDLMKQVNNFILKDLRKKNVGKRLSSILGPIIY